MILSERHGRIVRRWFPWVSLAGGVWSAFAVGRTWEEVHWIGWVLAAAWASAASLGALESLPDRWFPHRAGSLARTLVGAIAQNATQEVLFFILPFWIRSTTFLSWNGPFTVLLVLTAAATLYDPWYLQGILAHRTRRALFSAFVMFACLVFLFTALSSFSTVECLAISGAWSGAVAGFHLSRKGGRGMLAGAFAGLALAWSLRLAIAPVPMRLVGPVTSTGVVDLRPIDSVSTIPCGSQAWFWSPVFVPPGRVDSVLHIWILEGEEKSTILLPVVGGRREGFRTWSNSRMVATRPGSGRVQARLRGGQLLGEARFEIVDP